MFVNMIKCLCDYKAHMKKSVSMMSNHESSND